MNRSCAPSNALDRERALPVILLAGPTAAGKTSLSLELARSLDTHIVNADSMQVYRFMDIGTAKPSPAERALVPHHLLDVADPDEQFDAVRYADTARPVVESLHRIKKIPLVVGGTGLYMKVLTRGICSGPSSDPELKARLLDEEKTGGLPLLYSELERIDPEAAARIHQNDRQRILRAVEVFRLTGVPLSVQQKRHGFDEELFSTLKIFIFRDREELYRRIDLRVDRMIEEGLKEEVARLLDMGYGPDLKPMQSLGYKQMAQHLLGACDLDRAIYLIKRDTRHYAKRQLTWFRADPAFQWFHAEDCSGILAWIAGRLEEERSGA